MWQLNTLVHVWSLMFYINRIWFSSKQGQPHREQFFPEPTSWGDTWQSCIIIRREILWIIRVCEWLHECMCMCVCARDRDRRLSQCVNNTLRVVSMLSIIVLLTRCVLVCVCTCGWLADWRYCIYITVSHIHCRHHIHQRRPVTHPLCSRALLCAVRSSRGW